MFDIKPVFTEKNYAPDPNYKPVEPQAVEPGGALPFGGIGLGAATFGLDAVKTVQDNAALFGSYFDEVRKTSNFDAGGFRQQEVFTNHVKKVKELTGKDVPNPVYQDVSSDLADPERQRKFNDAYLEHKKEGYNTGYTEFAKQYVYKEFLDELEKIAQQHPDKRSEILPERDFYDSALGMRRDASQAKEKAWKESSQGIAAYTAAAAGMLAGGFTDHVNLALMLAQPQVGAARGAAGLATAAVKSGLYNAGAEVAVQPFKRADAALANMPMSYLDSVVEVGSAFGIGAGLDLGFRGAFRGVQTYRGLEPILKDDHIIGWKRPGDAPDPATVAAPGTLIEPTPLDISPELTARAFGEGADAVAARAEIAKRIESAPDHVSMETVIKAESGDVAAQRKVAEVTGEIERPDVRARIEAEETANATLRNRPSELVDDDTHLAAVKQSLAYVADPQGNLPPARVLESGPATGWLRDLREKVDQLQAKVQDTLTDEDRKALLVVNTFDRANADPVAAARMLREEPARMTRDLDFGETGLGQARSIATLTDEAFERVAAGEYAPEIGALVADHVPESHQIRALQDLTDRAPTSEDNARAVLADMLKGPEYRTPSPDDESPVALRERQMDDPYGKEARSQVQQLENDLAEELGRKAAPDPTPVEIITDAIKKADEVRAAVESMAGMLPDGVRVKTYTALSDVPDTVVADMLAANRQRFQRASLAYQLADNMEARAVARLELDEALALRGVEALVDTADANTIWLASYAMNPRGRIAHEAVHILKAQGRIAPDELTALAQFARESGAFSPSRQASYAEAYAKHGTPERIAELLDEEAVSHLIEARANGKLDPVDIPPRVLTVLDRIAEFFDSIRNALVGKGFKSTAETTFAARKAQAAEIERLIGTIMDGEAAKRVATQAVMQAEDIKAMAVRPGAATDMRAAIAEPMPVEAAPVRDPLSDQIDGAIDQGVAVARMAGIDVDPLAVRGMVDEAMGNDLATQLAAREAVADALMQTPEYKAATAMDPSYSSHLREGYGSDADRAARTFNTPDGEIKGVDAAASYLYRKAIEAVPGGVAAERKVFVLIGYPGAGKSSIAEAIRLQRRAVHIVADDAKLIVPEYEGGKGSSFIHEESTDIAGDVLAKAASNGDNIIVEKLGSSDKSIDKVAAQFKRNGYEVALIHVDVDRAIAKERAARRFTKTGRGVPSGIYNELQAGNVFDTVVRKGNIDAKATVRWDEPSRSWQLEAADPAISDLTIASREPASSRERGVVGLDRGAVDGQGVQARGPQVSEAVKSLPGSHFPRDTMFAFSDEQIDKMPATKAKYKLVGGPGDPPLIGEARAALKVMASHIGIVSEQSVEAARGAKFYAKRRELGSPLEAVKQANDNRISEKGNIETMRREATGQSFNYDIEDVDGKRVGRAYGWVVGKEMYFDWLGGGSDEKNALGVRVIKDLREQVRKDFPQVTKFTGYRVSGARSKADANNKMQSVTMFAFAGERAKTADLEALSRAKKMADEGKDRTEIWTSTGWFRGVDGKWRFEIDDSGARLDPAFESGDVAPLTDAMRHPGGLFHAYPELDRVSVSFDAAMGRDADFNTRTKELTVAPGNMSAVLHEAQHAVQGSEGFASGGNERTHAVILLEKYDHEFKPLLQEASISAKVERAKYDAAMLAVEAARADIEKSGIFGRSAARQKFQDALDRAKKQQQIYLDASEAETKLILRFNEAQHHAMRSSSFDTYTRLSGEAEARLVQRRMAMSPEERRSRPPWLDYDVPEDQQIVRFGQGQQNSHALFAMRDSDTGQSMRRDLDALGYYSHALEVARVFPLTEKVKASVKEEGQALFAMRDERGREKLGAAERAAQLKDDLAAIETRFQAAGGDEREKLQAKRAVLLNARAQEKRLDEIEQFKSFAGTFDRRKVSDPARAFLLQHEAYASISDVPFMDLKHKKEIIERDAMSRMADVAYEYRKGAITGDMRRRGMRTSIDNMMKEAAGENTGDALAKKLAHSWLSTAEYLRQRFNAAGGDIGKLEGWIAPQHHDAEMLMTVGQRKWVDYLMGNGVLDRERMLDLSTGKPFEDAALREVLGDIWLTITTSGKNKLDPDNPVMGRGAMYKRHMDNRIIHFKDAESWLKYQREMGSGDVVAAMYGHISRMSRDIAAMEVYGANPALTRERIKAMLRKQAAEYRPGNIAMAELGEVMRKAWNRLQSIDHGTEFSSAVREAWDSVRSANRRVPDLSGMLGDLAKSLDELRTTSQSGHVVDDAAFMKMEANLAILEKVFTQLDGDSTGGPLAVKGRALMNDIRNEAEFGSVFAKKKSPQSYTDRMISRADEVWDSFMGTSNVPVDYVFAQWAAGTRNWIQSSALVFTPFASITDFATQLGARRFNGIPAMSQLSAYLNAFKGASKEEMLRAGLGHEVAMASFQEQAMSVNRFNAHQVSGFIADRSHTFSFLSPMTAAQKTGFSHDFMTWMPTLQKLPYNELPPEVQRMFKRHGVSILDWDLRLRKVEPEMLGGSTPALTRNAIQDQFGIDLADKYVMMLLRERAFSTIESGYRARTLITSNSKAGTLLGELARSGGMFKAFPTMYTMLIIGRQYSEIMNGRYGSFAAYTGAVTIGGMMLAALAIQTKHILQGRDPEDMRKPTFFVRSFMQAGGGGIFGDFINQATDRNQNSVGETILGPMFGLGQKLLNLTLGNAGQFGREEKTNTGREAIKLARGLTPGMFVPWYLRLAYNRLIMDELQKAVDPDAHKAFQSQRRNTQKLTGNDYFWGPGEKSPPRGPRIGASMGAQ